MRIHVSGHRQASLLTTARTAHFVLAGSLSLSVVVFALCNVTPMKNRIVSPPSATSATFAGNPRGYWYFRMGQWRADARTVVAAVRYILDPDSQNPLSKPPFHASVPNPRWVSSGVEELPRLLLDQGQVGGYVLPHRAVARSCRVRGPAQPHDEGPRTGAGTETDGGRYAQVLVSATDPLNRVSDPAAVGHWPRATAGWLDWPGSLGPNRG